MLPVCYITMILNVFVVTVFCTAVCTYKFAGKSEETQLRWDSVRAALSRVTAAECFSLLHKHCQLGRS